MISIKFFAQQVMMVLMATTVWVANAGFVDSQLGGMKWAIWIGYVLNFASIPLILLAALHRPLIQTIANFLIRLGGETKNCQHPEESILRISAGLDVYHASILRLGKHPWQIVGQLHAGGHQSCGDVIRFVKRISCLWHDGHPLAAFADHSDPSVPERQPHAPTRRQRRAGGRVSDFLQRHLLAGG